MAMSRAWPMDEQLFLYDMVIVFPIIIFHDFSEPSTLTYSTQAHISCDDMFEDNELQFYQKCWGRTWNYRKLYGLSKQMYTVISIVTPSFQM